MLTISKPISAGQARAYYQEEFSNAQRTTTVKVTAYVASGTGNWLRSGLHGRVEEEHFRWLSDGQHPVTGEQLVRYQTAREYVNEHGNTIKAGTHAVELRKKQRQLHRVDREDPLYEDNAPDYQFSFGAVPAPYSCSNCAGSDSNGGNF